MSPSLSSRPRRQRKSEFRNQREEKLRYENELTEAGIDNPVTCDNCLRFDLCCRIIPNGMGRSLKCGECFKAGTACSYTSWDALDRRRAELKERIGNDERRRDQLLLELGKIQSRLDKDKQTLVREQEEAREKARCLAHKLADSGEDVFADVSAARAIEEQLFGPLGPGVLVDLDMPENVSMSG